jgi:hypothetical protein
MKIVISFDDPEMARLYNLEAYTGRTYWKWGLGDDKTIYWSMSENGDWRNIANMGWIGKLLTIQRLKMIVERFENLMPFL